MFNFKTLGALTAVVALMLGCTASPTSADYDQMTQEMMQTSFRDKGIAKVSRLNTDEANRLCSAADASGQPLDEAAAKAIEAANMKTIQWPKDGQFLGDWKQGEAIAQSGRGLTWSDSNDKPNGGNCYNCHQVSKEEVSFGTLGPSLYNYGKLRGVTDPNAAASKAIVEYTWGKLWNARAYNACSQMPRVGHGGILDEAQLKDVMALLLDPKSPVNQ